MSYTVYILYSEKDEGLYVGCTSDIAKRMGMHNNGQVTATAKRRPLSLIYTETISETGEAFQRERFLKSLWGAREKKKILKRYRETRNSHLMG
ncbi:GIY-YIG nuclease family protein [Acetobacteraceae bacterium]|nr:GIY-YIG nuclease family protein [Candidatus Parcubacteria bacterium]